MAERIKIKSEKKCERCGETFPYPYQHLCGASESYRRTEAARMEIARRTKTLAGFFLFLMIGFFLFLMIGSSILSAQDQAEYEMHRQAPWMHSSSENFPDFDAIVDAIYIIEGGNRTRYPFGVKSVRCVSYEDCRQVAANTVVNNYRRWEKAGRPGEYLDFLADRYCPPSVDKQGNANWKKNMRRIIDGNRL